MRKKIVAGNWKMNKNLQEGIDLTKEILQLESEIPNDVSVIIGTPFIHLSEINKIIKNSKVSLAAQNCAKEKSGAFTGEISAEMLNSCGCEYVILGHSERRSYYGENNSILVEKIRRAFENNLKVIFCIGEVLEERESNKHFGVIADQLENGLFHLNNDEMNKVVIAYEPVWAIGTGKTASSEQAQEMHAYIRTKLAEKYGENTAEQTSILYGGSCKPSNAKELFANKDVDGGLIGGASLKATDFISLTKLF